MYSELLRRTIGSGRTTRAIDLSAQYKSLESSEDILAFQLSRFNDVWSYAISECLYWAEVARKHRIPASLRSLDELDRFPVLDKAEINANSELIFRRKDGENIKSYYMTSGSTGSPTRFPRGPQDIRPRADEVFAYRADLGVLPFDRFVYFGGLPGSTGRGLSGKLHVAKRHMMDLVGNSRRRSGYVMDTAATDEAVELIRRFRPKYLVGFPSKILEIARRSELHHSSSEYPYLDLVILSSENFTEVDTDLIGKAFGCRVVSEYGAEEVGVVAASGSSAFPMDVRWRSIAIRETSDRGDFLVTTLGKRLFPLIQYDLGDLIEPGVAENGNVLSINRVKGRSREVVRLGAVRGGDSYAVMPLHLMNFLKVNRSVVGVQFFQRRQDALTVYIGVDGDVSLEALAGDLARKVREFYPLVDLGLLELALVPEMILGAREKHKVVLERPHPGVVDSVNLGDSQS
ncbi:phenylacetate--CoA ligase family protein [Dietzia maris]